MANNENGKGSKRGIKKRRKEIRRKNKKSFPKVNPNRKKIYIYKTLCCNGESLPADTKPQKIVKEPIY